MVTITQLVGGIGLLRRFLGPNFRGLWAFVFVCGVWGFHAHADHPFHSDIYPDFGAEEWAKMSMEYADLIAAGQFVSVCDTEFDKPVLQNFRLVTAKFKLEEVFKGRHDIGDTVDVTVVADMLAYPGERVTRYEKRREVRQELNDRRDTVKRTLEGLTRSNTQGPGVANDRESDLHDELSDINRRLLNIPPSMLAVLRQPSFYEVGGMIETNVKYVIALSRLEDDGSFRLAQSYDRDIFWGEEAKQMAEAFRSLAPR